LGGAQVGGNTAHACHLGGYLFGYVYHARGWQLNGMFSRLKVPSLPRLRKKSHLKVYQPQRDSTEMEARMDEILQKISVRGEASLTDEEREILADASRRLRNKTRS
jgi:hypothetical protein